MLQILLSSAIALGASGAVEVPCNTAAANSHRDRATDLYRQERLSDAINELNQAVSACATEPFFRFMLANALYRANRLQESKASYQAAVERQPTYFEARMSLGFTLFELGERDDAVKHWLSAMQLKTDSAFARAALAVGLFSTGDVENALMQYEQAILRDPRYADAKALSLDIRWKPAILKTLSQLKELFQTQ